MPTDPDTALLPVLDDAISADAELDAAVALATEERGEETTAADPPIPYGRSWSFDFERGRFRRPGDGAPAEVEGEEALEMWILAALHTAAGAHPIFSDDFGMEDPTDVIGTVDPAEALSDWDDRVADALLVHDRIASVENVEIEWDPSAGIVYVRRIDINTDEEEAVRLLDVPVSPEV